MKLKIGFIGSGNVAWHFARALNAAGHSIIQVISREKNHAKALADVYDCVYSTDVKKLSPDVELCIVCVSDDQLTTVAKQIPSSDNIVVHTCGSHSINILETTGENHGVFYPLQSFSKDRQVDINSVPFLLEASNPETLIVLHTIASSLSHYVLTSDSEARLKYHLSAVLVNNFVNHLYVEAETYLIDNQLDFNVLKPIIKETAMKIQNLSPVEAQTGPAKRGDDETIKQHLKLLEDSKNLKALYKTLSDVIEKTQ
ncbi:MAG: putative short-subunit dehydrogenase-like oxidoreductase (DUF2520 family) [Bacteroidia bacterium]|jgi:predicted short-subunit dehydrogenase-like oxidoreductase (DUF2520 family)